MSPIKPLFGIALIGVFLFGHASWAEKTVQLQAGSIHYSEDNKILVASNNVVLTSGEVQITAPRMIVENHSKMIATGNVWIKRGDDSFKSTDVEMDLEKERVKVEDIHVWIHPKESSKPLQMRAETLEDYPTYKKGENALISSCDLEDPHYYFKSRYLKYYPNKRMLGFGTFLKIAEIPLIGFPIGLPLPYYIFELGKRRIVWNTPVIGKKSIDGWGWFMQNTIDYDRLNGKDSSIFVDWFATETITTPKAVGLGVRHQYEMGDQNFGTAYYYSLNDADTHQQLGEAIQWEQEIELSPIDHINLKYTRKNGVKINNLRSKEDTEYKEIKWYYNDLGNIWSSNLSISDDYQFSRQRRNFGFKRQFNQQTYADFTYAENKPVNSEEENQNARLRTTLDLPYEIRLNNDIYYYYRVRTSGDSLVTTQYIKTKTQFDKTLAQDLKASLLIDQLEDLRTDKTIENSDYNYLYKEPEFQLNWSPKFGNLQSNSKLTMSRLREVKYISAQGKVRDYQKNSPLMPNTYILNQDFNYVKPGLPMKGSWNLHTDYDQYVFQTPGHDIWEGDQMAAFGLNTSYTNDIFSVLRTNTRYSWRNLRKESNSPFFEFDRALGQDEDRISTTLTMHYKEHQAFSWEHQGGYDFKRDQANTYTTRLVLKPVNAVKLESNTGWNFQSETWQSLGNTVTLAPSQNKQIMYYISRDINDGFFNSSYINFSWYLGDNEEYRWELRGTFTYPSNKIRESYSLEEYELNRINIVKQAHCREFAFEYNKTLEEFRFQFTIKAFPKDNIGFNQNKNGFKILGFIDKESEERL